ncbi:hypothetical protein Q5752_001834 [Cryptotrichosporon argae]
MSSPDSPTPRPVDAYARPALSRSSSAFSEFMSRQAERYGDEWGGGTMTLLDTFETFFDSRLDLFERRLKAQSARLKQRATDLLPRGLRTPASGHMLLADDDDDEGDKKKGDRYRTEVEREVERMKVKLASKVTQLSASWRSAQIVRTREKVSFLFGVCTLTFTCILFGMAPEWIPFAYTVQCLFYLPTRAWSYKRKALHYFLFGHLCYFVNLLDLLWLWIMPSSTVLFISCYLLTMGPLASAIITWRNSLVFHSLDKVTSLFIHIYPPIVFTIILQGKAGSTDRYPGLAHINEYTWWYKILLAAIPYCVWQAAYYKFISVDRKAKVESGQRQNSFHYLVNDKRGPIGRLLRGIRPEHRELWFIFAQFIYSLIFMTPPAVLFIHSTRASAVFLVAIFIASAWNGASFYVEVFGRKFERELERLRKEMEVISSTGVPSTAPTSANSTPYLGPHDAASPTTASAASPRDHDEPTTMHAADAPTDADGLAESPLVLPDADDKTAHVPELTLGKPAADVVGESKKDQ